MEEKIRQSGICPPCMIDQHTSCAPSNIVLNNVIFLNKSTCVEKVVRKILNGSKIKLIIFAELSAGVKKYPDEFPISYRFRVTTCRSFYANKFFLKKKLEKN